MDALKRYSRAKLVLMHPRPVCGPLGAYELVIVRVGMTLFVPPGLPHSTTIGTLLANAIPYEECPAEVKAFVKTNHLTRLKIALKSRTRGA